MPPRPPCWSSTIRARLSELDHSWEKEQTKASVSRTFSGLSGFPNAETLNLTMSYVDVGLIGHRVQTRKGPV